MHARRINMFTRFSFCQASRKFDAKSDTLEEHAGTDFIGRTDAIILFHRAGRIFDASILRIARSLDFRISFHQGKPDIWRKQENFRILFHQ